MASIWERVDELHASPAGVPRRGPDEFPTHHCAPDSEEQRCIGELLSEAVAQDRWSLKELTGSASGQCIVRSAPEQKVRYLRAVILRVAWVSLKTAELRKSLGSRMPWSPEWHRLSRCHHVLESTVRRLIQPKLPLGISDLQDFLDWLLEAEGWYGFEKSLCMCILAAAEEAPENVAPALRTRLEALARRLRRMPDHRQAELLLERVRRLLPGGVQLPLAGGEAWSERALADIAAAEARREAWCALVEHCMTATAAAPSAKWLGKAQRLVEAVGLDEVRSCVIHWFPLVDKPRTRRPQIAPYGDDAEWTIVEPHVLALRGLIWCCSFLPDQEVARVLAGLALSAYRKLPRRGPRLPKLGHACIWAVGAMPGPHALAQLARLRVAVRFIPAQKLIEKALVKVAERQGVSREDIEELAVPSYGLTEAGLRRETLGDYTAELHVGGASATELRWRRADGKPQKSIPAVVRTEHAGELKELQQAAKDIQRMLPAQRERLDQLYLQRRSWPYAIWRERYLDHPLIGTLARRLIWRFSHDGSGSAAAAAWHDGRLVGQDGAALDDPARDVRVELWHPLGEPVERVLAWRAWLEQHEVRQPFKQAHREVYLLTDAERQTATYSNRFAAHLLRQHQFNALCAARGWKNALRLLVDQEFPPASRALPAWGLRAEFWIEGAGTDYGVDTNDTGTYWRVATDQVRYYRLEAAQHTAHAYGGGYHAERAPAPVAPLPLQDIPPLVFSEIMRDVDLFVGVASVGNDPAWSDGGPDGRYRDYWHSYAFGELGESAQTRRHVLERLLPRLKIAPRAELRDRFLVVRGDVRTYKIHLGSGNILMEPDDQYLCIVPARSSSVTDKLYLPFEGDQTLAVILSKALLLAEDAKITDPTITQQIRARR